MPYEQSIDYEDRARQRIERGRFTIRGITDEVGTCDCCGRNDLKRAVALEDEGGEVVYYGTTCAALAMNRSTADVRKESRKAQQAKDDEAMAELRRRRDAEFADWQSFLQAASWMPGKLVCDIVSAIGYPAMQAHYQQWRKLKAGR